MVGEPVSKHVAAPPEPRVGVLAALARLAQIELAIVVACGVYLRERLRLRGKGAESRQRAAGRALLQLCNRLGATFIKIGQILSTRADLLPQPLLDELAVIQDQVPPFPFPVVRATVEAELGRPLEGVYERFEEEPVAAGSIAQVHRAVLRATGEDVAVKVRRPDIRRKMLLDRAILKSGARFLERVSRGARLLSIEQAVEEFCAAVAQQIDFVREAENNARLSAFAVKMKAHEDWIFPATFPAASTQAVLTMEWAEGLREDELPGSGVDLPLLIRNVARAVCKCVYLNGFVHADPHPGNVRFLPPGKCVMFDFGLVAELDPEERRAFARMMFSLGTGDGGSLAKILYEQAPRRDVRDYAAYEAEMVALATDVHRRPLRELSLVYVVGSIFDIMRRHRVQARANHTMVYLTFLAMEGLSKRLAPDLILFDEILPYMAEGLELLPPSPALSGGTVAARDEGGNAEQPSFGSGRYQVVRLLGEGARKRVYVARDATLAREVALAVLKDADADGASLARMTLEARAMAGLGDHPRIVAVHDFGQENGRPYFVSELMAGGTLEELLERRESGGLAVTDAMRIAGEVCQALAHAHSRGVLHCDVKPANLWLTADGSAKLGDFGLATAPERMPKTPHRAIVGTVTYMAPEQALGKAIEARSDLYSVGCLLYEMLTGEPPFIGDAAAVLAQHLQTAPAPPSMKNRDVPEALDALVVRCLAKQIGDRPASAAELEQALAEIASMRTSEGGAALQDDLQRDLFVGREHEMSQLVAALDDAMRGRGRVSLLLGDPGIGKTRTANELAVHARRRGVRVLLGRCHEGEGAPAFWPWVQILRAYISTRDAKSLVVEAGLAAPVIAQVVPELHERIPGLEVTRLEGEEARFRLFDGITRFLRAAAAAQPLLLILDDLHWADKPSLLLLQFLAREIDEARIIVVGTYRDVEVQQGHPLAEVLPSIRRAHGHERIRLRGLREPEVRKLLAACGGAEIAPSITQTIYRETEGNPFFVGEVVKHLMEEGKLGARGADEIGIPESVRDVISRRIGRLSEPTRRALTLASVIGRDFDFVVLERVANGESAALETALTEAITAGVVGEVPRAVGRFRFAHALIRETLYGDLRTGQRVGLHKKTAEAIEAIHGDRSSRHLSELAYHYAEAAPLGEIDKAVSYALRAGEQANAQFAPEEAARCFTQALECLALADTADEAQRCELLLMLGDARFNAGEFDAAKATFYDAASLAERIGDAERLGRAAFGLGGGFNMSFESSQPSEKLMALLEKAIAALGASESALRAKLMVRFAAQYGSGLLPEKDPVARMAMAREAIALARRSGDREALAFVLATGSYAIQAPDTIEERLHLFDESLELAREQKTVLRFLPTMLRGQARVELGDIDGAIADARELERAPETIRFPYARALHLNWEVTLATFEGRFEDAERLIGEVLAAGEESNNRDAVASGYSQLLLLRYFQGRIDEALGSLVTLTERMPTLLVLQYLPLAKLSGMDFRDLAKSSPQAKRAMSAAIEQKVKESLAVRIGAGWVSELCVCAEFAVTLEDREALASIYEALLPYADRCASILRFFLFGSVSRSLGLVATLLSRFDDAERHFEAALAMNRRIRTPLFVAITQQDYAWMLLRRGSGGDREKALDLLAEAIETHQRLGSKRYLEGALALRLQAQGLAGADVKTSIDAVADSVDTRRPDLTSHAAPDGTVTLLFSDVEGFTTMTDRLGDRRAHEIMREHNEIVRGEVRGHGGHEVELMGDGFLLAFSSARRGLDCAVAIQKRFAEYNEKHSDEPLRVRMGLHTGETIRDANKFFGRAVILAARIAAHARGGEILVSSLFRELTQRDSELPFGNVREVELKGLAGAHGVCAVGWDGREPADVADSRPAPVAPIAEPVDHVFRRNGDFWTITFEGRSLTLRDTKGLNYISRLLNEAGREIHVLDLLDGGSRAAGPAAQMTDRVSSDLGSAGEILDPRARAEYQERLEDLKLELEEAEAANDIGRTARLREEIDFLGRELASAFGLGGRARKAGDSSERARKAVSGRITESIAKIAKEHPALGAHLANAIRLGTFCEYRPEKPTEWKL